MLWLMPENVYVASTTYEHIQTFHWDNKNCLCWNKLAKSQRSEVTGKSLQKTLKGSTKGQLCSHWSQQQNVNRRRLGQRTPMAVHLAHIRRCLERCPVKAPKLTMLRTSFPSMLKWAIISELPDTSSTSQGSTTHLQQSRSFPWITPKYFGKAYQEQSA